MDWHDYANPFFLRQDYACLRQDRDSSRKFSTGTSDFPSKGTTFHTPRRDGAGKLPVKGQNLVPAPPQMPVPWRVQGAAACRKFPWRHGRKCVPLHHQATRKNGQATDRRPVSLSTVAMEGPSCETEAIPGKDITQCLLSKARPMLPGEKRGSKAVQSRHDLHPHTTNHAPQAASCRGWHRKTLPSEGCCAVCRPTTGTSGENPRLTAHSPSLIAHSPSASTYGRGSAPTHSHVSASHTTGGW